jgi:hypothetical protein
MIREKELRARVQRLIAGDIRLDDFSRLFQWLRFRSYGAASIKEIGHFEAHSDERDTGLVTDDARDFFQLIRLRAPNWNAPIDLSTAPEGFPDLMLRSFERIDSPTIKAKTNLKRKTAASALKSALTKFLYKEGRWYIQSALLPMEFDCIKFTAGTLVSRPIFTEDSLFRDFSFVLQKNNLIETKEQKLLDRVKAPLALYALSRMHGVELKLADDWKGNLRAGVGTSAKTVLYVNVSAPIPANLVGASAIIFATPIYSTGLQASEWCTAELMGLLDNGHLWSGPIEINKDMKLDLVR